EPLLVIEPEMEPGLVSVSTTCIRRESMLT
ncbi:unnamed protein product, partial [Oikopleura dioica]